MERLVSSAYVREHFGISGMTLWRWCERGVIARPKKINGRNYWPLSALTAVSDAAMATARRDLLARLKQQASETGAAIKSLELSINDVRSVEVNIER